MKKWMLILVSIGFLLLVIIIAAFAGLITVKKSFTPGSNPVVDIKTPSPDFKITARSPVIFQAVARDPDGVVRVEFWLDQVLTHVQTSPWEEGITPLPAATDVRISLAGSHELVVRAFDSLGNSGQASRMLDVSAGPDLDKVKTYEVQEGDTLESIALAHGHTPEDITAANSGLDEGGLLDEGAAISIPLPPTDGEGMPDESPADLPEDSEVSTPPYLPLEEDTPPAWMIGLRNFFNPVSFPSGLLELTSLEVDRSYDGVFCYVSAGDMPVIRVPGSGFLTNIEGNFWDIAEWFSGEHALPFISSSDDLRLRMNCMGLIETIAGGTAYNLGTLDISRPLSGDIGTVVDEQIAGPDGWFRIHFRIDGYGEGHGGGGGDEEYAIALTWVRRVAAEIPEMPNPHVLLTWQYLDDGVPISSIPFDYYLLYRDGEIIGRMATMPNYHILWDTNGETGSCEYLTEVYIEGYPGIPVAGGTEPIRSNSVFFYGYCNPKWLHVVVRMKYFKFIDVFNLDQTCGLTCMHGGCDPEWYTAEELNAIIPEHTSNLENYGPGCYGGVNVNGTRIWDIGAWCPVTAPLLVNFGERAAMIDLGLPLDESLVITSTMWDYDVWSDSDVMCPGTITFSPTELLNIQESGSSYSRSYPLCDLDSTCTITLEVSAELMEGPPPPVMIP